MTENEIATIVVNSAYQVHSALGPGLLESVYQSCMHYELVNAGLPVKSQVPFPVIYKDVKLDCGFRADFLIENKLIIEIKAIDSLHPIHTAQLLTYLRLSNTKLGILINFNVVLIKDGIKRLANNL